jgi:hypothetical protein
MRTEREPLGQEVSPLEPPDVEPTAGSWAENRTASSPEWLCRMKYGDFYDQPVHCQAKAFESLSAEEIYPTKTEIVETPPPYEAATLAHELLHTLTATVKPSAMSRGVISKSMLPNNRNKDDHTPVLPTITVEVKIPMIDMSEIPGFADASQSHLSNSIISRPRLNLDPESDCAKFVNEVQRIANESKDANDFINAMVKRFIGNLEGTSKTDFEKSATVGSREFGSSGFQDHLKDDSNQVRHFTGGLWAGYLYGSGVGLLGMNSNESSVFTDSRGLVMSAAGILPSLFPSGKDAPDVALNSISTHLGARLVPSKEKKVEVGDRGGWKKIPGNIGYPGLADEIRSKVCEP